MGSKVSYSSGGHQLLPVPLAHGWVLKLIYSPQGCQQVLHGGLQAYIHVPCTDLFIQGLNLLWKTNANAAPSFWRLRTGGISARLNEKL